MIEKEIHCFSQTVEIGNQNLYGIRQTKAQYQKSETGPLQLLVNFVLAIS